MRANAHLVFGKIIPLPFRIEKRDWSVSISMFLAGKYMIREFPLVRGVNDDHGIQ